MVNSNSKGKRGELEFAHALTDMGIQARRGQQFSGSPDSPDVVTDLKGVHFEVKRCESLSLYKALAQAEDECGDSLPVVAHRRNNKPWLVCVKLDDLLAFCRLVVEQGGKDEREMDRQG